MPTTSVVTYLGTDECFFEEFVVLGLHGVHFGIVLRLLALKKPRVNTLLC